MADVPISNALIDSAQFQIQSAPPATPDTGLVRLFRGTDGWLERTEDGGILPVSTPLRRASITLSPVELLAIDTTPVEIVPSPTDPLAVNVVVFATFRYIPGTTPYAGSGFITVQWASLTDATEAQPSIASFLGASDARFFMTPGHIFSQSYGPLADMVGPLQIGTNGAPLTLGDGTVVVELLYFEA